MTTEKEFRAYCEIQGIDIELLLDRAARHFEGSLRPRQHPLTDEEVQAYIDAEMGAEGSNDGSK